MTSAHLSGSALLLAALLLVAPHAWAADAQQRYGAFFVFRSDCPASVAQGAVLRSLAARTGLRVLPISLDDRGIASWPAPRPASRIGPALGIAHVPAIFLFDAQTRRLARVGAGLMHEPRLVLSLRRAIVRMEAAQ